MPNLTAAERDVLHMDSFDSYDSDGDFSSERSSELSPAPIKEEDVELKIHPDPEAPNTANNLEENDDEQSDDELVTVGPSKSQYRPKETLEKDDDPNSAYGEERMLNFKDGCCVTTNGIKCEYCKNASHMCLPIPKEFRFAFVRLYSLWTKWQTASRNRSKARLKKAEQRLKRYQTKWTKNVESHITHKEKQGGSKRGKTSEDSMLLVVDRLEQLIRIQEQRLDAERYVANLPPIVGDEVGIATGMDISDMSSHNSSREESDSEEE
ncbi:hypothetical protein MMC14_008256 [Varicellaria rhodocarpa]|nr:hypothetical protein [Varicellaria rhodocarpa]